MGKTKAILLLSACSLVISPSGFARTYQLTSPNGRLKVSVELKTLPQPHLPGERVYYRVDFQGKAIVVDSPLGLDFLGHAALDQGFEVVREDRDAHDSTWENPFGARRKVRDHYNQMTISLREKQAPNRRVDLIFRACDDGVAFRYALPEQAGLHQFTLAAENTGFNFAAGAHAYALNIRSYTTPNESDYPYLPLDAIKPTSVVPLPLLVQIPQGPWVGLLEADLTNYAGMYVGGVPGNPGALVSKLSPLPKRSDQAVIASTPMATPWRVLMVNPTPTGLLEANDLVLNLSTPCALSDTSWIKPGKVTFPWWSGFWGGHGAFPNDVNTAMFKYYIDFAARAHLEYIEISDYWYKGPKHSVKENYSPDEVDITQQSDTVDIQEVLAYARQKGVKCLLWLDWPPLMGHMDTAIPLYEKWGAAGLKVDLMDRDDQEMVNFYQRVTELCAAHHLLVYFHGAYKPTGLRRTYPNLLNRESVMGEEHDKGESLVTPEYDVTLPFVRLLAGPMDYTPGGFRNATRAGYKALFVEPMVQGTRAHELAKYVVYLAPLEMVSDDPEAYEGQPEFAFLQQVPTVWDETKVVGGEPGKFITVAREKDGAWYIGSMTNWDSRDIKVPLEFLGQGSYRAQIFADGADADRVATSVQISEKSVNRGDRLNLHLAPGGGAAVILTPVR